MTVLQGVCSPVLTPFRGRAAAHDGLVSNLARLNARPLSGYVGFGPTGEFPLLAEGEILATAGLL